MLQPAHAPRTFPPVEPGFPPGGQALAEGPEMQNAPVALVALVSLDAPVPLLADGWLIDPGGRMGALCQRSVSGAGGNGRALPPLVSGRPGTVRFREPRVFPCREAVQDWMLDSQTKLETLYAGCNGCHEVRVSLGSPHGSGPASQDPVVSQEQARLLAKLAQGLRDHARRMCVTPDHLRSDFGGEQKMALSLLVEVARQPGVDAAIALAHRMSNAHALILKATQPGPIESFAVGL